MQPFFGLSLIFLISFAGAVSGVQPMQLQQVDERIYALVGPYGDRTPENLGNNSTSGVILTDDGVVLIDPGASYKGAEAIHRMIQRVTDQPVKLVINTGGQDHRWLGNDYFKRLGAHIIASQAAVDDQRERSQDQLIRLDARIGEEVLAGTEPLHAEQAFEDELRIEHGGVVFELMMVGPAHTPGDTLVWLPQQRVAFSGDVVYIGRMVGVIPVSSSANWLQAFDRLAALQPKVIVPGHGGPVDLAVAKADTRDYLAFLRGAVASLMDEGGDITQVGRIDQSDFSYLHSFELLKGRNAQQVFQQMEWE